MDEPEITIDWASVDWERVDEAALALMLLGLHQADLSDLAGRGVFKQWTDHPAEFGEVAVDPESGTLIWPGGLDVAPDRLYTEVIRAVGEVEASSKL